MSTTRRTGGAAAPEPEEPVSLSDPIDESTVEPAAGTISSGFDEAGAPIHHGWAPLGSRRRWMEPFLLVILSRGPVHGYAVIGRLEEMRISEGPVDVGQVYRTLRELEQAGLVTSEWSLQPQGAPRRDYAAHSDRLHGARRMGRGDEGTGSPHRRVRRRVLRVDRPGPPTASLSAAVRRRSGPADASDRPATRATISGCSQARTRRPTTSSFSASLRFFSRTPR